MQIAGYGLGFGLLAIMIGNFFDFGQRLPGKRLSDSHYLRITDYLVRLYQPQRSPSSTFAASRIGWTAIMALLTLLAGPVLARSVRTFQAETIWNQALEWEKTCSASNPEQCADCYQAIAANADKAIRFVPDMIEYRYQRELNRWQALQAKCRTSGIGPDFLPELHTMIHNLQAMNPLCPTWGFNLLLAGQLQWSLVPESLRAGERNIMTAGALLPCQPEACAAVGRIYLSQGALDHAVSAYKRYIILGGATEGGFFINSSTACAGRIWR